MIKRPLVWIVVGYICVYVFISFVFPSRSDHVHPMDYAFGETIEGNVEGKIDQLDAKAKGVALYLTEVKLRPEGSQREYVSQGVIVYFDGEAPFHIGNRVRFFGEIQKFQQPGNYGQFDEIGYYKGKNLDYKVYGQTMEIVDDKTAVWKEELRKIKEKLWEVYKKILGEKEAGVIGAMILGQKSFLSEAIKELYQANGISHVLAISGLHISLIGYFLFGLLRRTGMKEVLACILSIFLIISYGVLTNFGVSTFRAVTMLTCVFVGKSLGRTYDAKSAMALSGLILMVQNPRVMIQSGFLLSFGAVIGIAYVVPILQEVLPDNNKSVSNKIIFRLKQMLGKALILSISVNLTILPVISYFFYEISFYSVVLNLLVIPLLSFVVLLSLFGGILGIIYLPLGEFLMGSVTCILRFYQVLCEWFGSLPYSTFLLGKMELEKMVMYYLVLGVVLFCYNKFQRKLILLGLLFLILTFIKKEYGGLEVTFLDVGQGDCIFLKAPKGGNYLIDGGSVTVGQVGKYRIQSFLKAKAIRNLEYIFVTHLDTDHVSGIEELLLSAPRGGVIIKGLVLTKTVEEDETYERIRKLAREAGIPIYYMKRGEVVKNGKLTITCLHPDQDFETSSRNGYSLVLSIEYGKFDLLLTGDVESDGERAMLDGKQLKDYDVLKVSHHGSKNSTGMEFLEETKPEVAVISCGRENRFGHPHKELLNRLSQKGISVMSTSLWGAISIKTDGEKVVVEPFLEEER